MSTVQQEHPLAVAAEGVAGTVPVAAAGPVTRRRTRVRPAVLLSVVVLAVLAVWVLAPALVTGGGDPLAQSPADAFRAPSAAAPFGTDQNGRDVLTRVVFGARDSLLTGVAATALALGLAAVLGLLAGLSGRWVDTTVSRGVEVLLAFPGLLLALLLIATYGASVATAVVAVGIATAPGYARLIRAQALQIRTSPYVEASRALGHAPRRIIRRTIFPNVMRPLTAIAVMGIGQSIIYVSSLSFLGLGARPPEPEWGSMLANGRDYIGTAWWLAFFPGAFIVLATLATTVLGRYLQQRFEGREV